MLPSYISQLFQTCGNSDYNLRSNNLKLSQRFPIEEQRFTGNNIPINSLNIDICTIYNMIGRVVSDIQTRAAGESLYIRYNTDANVVNDLKNDSSYEFIDEVILKINVF